MMKIKEICQSIGLFPTKRKGQNFLINPKVLEDIIIAADLKPDDIVLEIGPGFGILTDELTKRAKKVIAVELDKKLANYLKEKFSAKGGSPPEADAPLEHASGGKNQKNVEIIQGDILKTDLRLKIKDLRYKLVANLPYNITGVVLRKFLSEEPKPKLLVLMVQKEVAERILAKNKKNTIISLMVAFYGQPEIVRFVSKNHFWPRPKVDSSILRISRIGTNLPRIDTNKFFQLIRQGFSSPRKQVINNLSKIIKKEKLKEIFKKLSLNPKIRAEDIDLEKWFQIYYYINI